MKKGDRVKLKGRIPEGIVRAIREDTHWVSVVWDQGKEGPKYVHEYELDTVNG